MTTSERCSERTAATARPTAPAPMTATSTSGCGRERGTVRSTNSAGRRGLTRAPRSILRDVQLLDTALDQVHDALADIRDPVRDPFQVVDDPGKVCGPLTRLRGVDHVAKQFSANT